MKKEKGFTIVELLVSFTLLTVVLIYLIKATTNMMTKENEILALQEYNVFESTLLNNIYDDTDGLTDLTVEDDNNGGLNIKVGNSQTIYKNISFVNNDTEKGIYYDNVLYELPENVKFNHENNSELYTLESGKYDDENSFVKNYSIIKIPLIDNGNEKEINIVFQNADQYKLIEGTILEKAQTLVYSNGICKNDGTTYNYMGGCYIKGANLNNYVWYNGFLWRIMGINGDNTVRLIMNENATTIPFSAENKAHEYSTSEGYVKDWLNNYFYNKLNSTRNIITYGNYFCNDVLSDVQQTRNSCTNKISNYIGTISIDEYLLAGSSNSYLNINQNSWTMTPASNSNVWGLYFKSSEHEVYSFNSTNAVGVRPVINVSSTSKITSGSGTSNDNYTLAEDKSTDKKDSTIDTASTGEYVNLNNNNYRIVSKDKDGVKLILDGYYESAYEYGEKTFSGSSGIGNNLNNAVLESLDLSDSNLLVTTDWYQGEVINNGFSYKDSLKETNSAKAKVGLIRLGEVLANNPSSSQVKTHWTLNVGDLYPLRIGTSGSAGNGQTNSSYVRPVIKIYNNSKISSGTGTPNNPYIIDDIKVVCRRATTLHTEECAWTDGTYYCSGAGYTSSGSKGTTTITYGNKGTKGTLSSGDAFDCDVNGDGTYDENTERFYYVNDYFNTSTKKFENDTAVLIYYNNVSGGETNNSKTYAYDSIDENWYGPVTAVKQLPKTDQWPNVSLKNTSRSILNEKGTNITTGGTLPSSFSYVGYSARFLTTQELEKACNVTVGNSITGELDNCNYLLENIKYSSNSLGSYGYWLETPFASQSIHVWHVRGDSRNVNYSSTSADGGAGVRPVIEVSKSNMSY